MNENMGKDGIIRKDGGARTVSIVCNGLFPQRAYPRYLLQSSDFILCCDGGVAGYMRNVRKIFGRERLPDVVIGDLDSLPGRYRTMFADRLVRVEEQETNDLTKAFSYVMAHLSGIRDIHLLAATGRREDHTIGNLSLLMEYHRQFDLREIRVDMVSDFSTMTALTDSASLTVGTGRRISIFTPDNSLKIKSEGLQWPTDGVVFDNWWKASLNRACRDEITLNFSHPSMALLIMD